MDLQLKVTNLSEDSCGVGPPGERRTWRRSSWGTSICFGYIWSTLETRGRSGTVGPAPLTAGEASCVGGVLGGWAVIGGMACGTRAIAGGELWTLPWGRAGACFPERNPALMKARRERPQGPVAFGGAGFGSARGRGGASPCGYPGGAWRWAGSCRLPSGWGVLSGGMTLGVGLRFP